MITLYEFIMHNKSYQYLQYTIVMSQLCYARELCDIWSTSPRYMSLAVHCVMIPWIKNNIYIQSFSQFALLKIVIFKTKEQDAQTINYI